MYILSNGHSYIGINSQNVATSVSNINKALQFSEEKKALNYKENLKSTLRKFNWDVVKVSSSFSSSGTGIDKDNEDVENLDVIYTYKETELEKSGFDISKFFNETIKTISQLREYANNMGYLEQEYNRKILDVRHYIRDEKTKLNAVQMQRIGYFLRQLERERYECKSNRMIAEMFLSDFNRMEDTNYIEAIKKIKESEYKPKVLSYEILDEIAGKRGNI